MRKILFLLICLFLGTVRASGAPLVFEPVTKKLPDGTELKLFLSGDEFFNYLHDASGYPVGCGNDGYFYYLVQKGDRFDITQWRTGKTDPKGHPEVGLVTIPSQVSEKRAASEQVFEKYGSRRVGSSAIKAAGTFNNLDGDFDNVSFIIRGQADGWSELLWPHRWVLFSKEVRLGKLKVNNYTIQLETVSISTLSHEMFHSLGAPDLYRYDNDGVPVGPWNIMANGNSWIIRAPLSGERPDLSGRSAWRATNSTFIPSGQLKTGRTMFIPSPRQERRGPGFIPSPRCRIRRILIMWFLNFQGAGVPASAGRDGALVFRLPTPASVTAWSLNLHFRGTGFTPPASFTRIPRPALLQFPQREKR